MQALKSKIDTAIEHSNLSEISSQFISVYEDFHDSNDITIAKEYASNANKFVNTKLFLNQDHILETEKEVCSELRNYICNEEQFDRKSIGIGYCFQNTIPIHYPYGAPIGLDTYDFTRHIIKAAAFMGSQRVIDYLKSWNSENPDPIEFEYRGKIFGAIPKVSPLGGEEVEIISPEVPSPKNVVFFEYLSKFRKIGFEYDNLVTLIIKYKRFPALYNPQDYIQANKNIHNCKITTFNLQSFCRFLSLECGVYIMPAISWIEPGKIWPLVTSSFNDISYNFNIDYKYIDEKPIAEITKTHYNSAKKYNNLRTKFPDKHIDITLLRWSESLNPYTDYCSWFMNLRMALESMFIYKEKRDKGDTNTKFIATRCAFMLGENSGQQEKNYKKLHFFYSLASELIHPFIPIQNEDDNYELYRQFKSNIKKYRRDNYYLDASELCKCGIKHILKTQKLPKWSEYYNSNEARKLQNKMKGIIKNEIFKFEQEIRKEKKRLKNYLKNSWKRNPSMEKSNS